MYLTRVEIDTEDRRKARSLTHLGAFHNWVEQSFPGEFTQGIRSRKLWRIDQLCGKKYLMILSESMPDTKALETYGKEGSAQCKNYDAYLQRLREGERLRFRLVANPVHAVAEQKGMRGVERPHITIQHQLDYLMKRTEKNGFHISEDEVCIVERGYEVLRKQGSKQVRVVKVAYEGILTITDIGKFRHALVNGIGKKKAYGFGLLTVIPEG